MSKHSTSDAINITQILAAKGEGRKLSVVTCYDGAFAKIIDKTGVDMVLVGDSVGNVMLGFRDTLRVTMEHMIHHTAAVARVLTKPFLIADMPFMSYNLSPEQALANAARFVQEAGAKAVKVEGGKAIVPAIEKIVAAGIPVMGHLGLTPQSVNAIGGYKVQGRGEAAAEKLIEDAKALAAAGCFGIVLELVPMSLAERVTAAVSVPTIGIGAGPKCDGQVLVLHDILGFDPDFRPKFLKTYASLGKDVQAAVSSYVTDVRSGQFPTAEHGFKD